MAKRLFDPIVATAGLVVLSPVFALVAVLIRWDCEGPVFFRQERVGLGGRPFRIFEFRTMRTDAESAAGQLTVRADPRVIRLGRVLRKWNIDETPQLLDVVRGETSFVGPRPEVPRYVALYTPDQRRILEVRPGITDPASIEFRDENELLSRQSDPEAYYIDTILPRKLDLNADDMERGNLGYDMWIIAATVWRVVAPATASDDG